MGNNYDEYQKRTAEVGKRSGTLSQDDLTYMASKSNDYGKTYAMYEMFNESDKSSGGNSNGGSGASDEGCYIATCVYGSYDCPEVWTLRRFRDRVLRRHAAGRGFIRLYYAVSPTVVKWFGDSPRFHRFWKGKLSRFVTRLQSRGFEDTPYNGR